MTRLPLVLLAGCAPSLVGPPAHQVAGERAAQDVVLTFGADWTEAASGTIVEGATVRVDYALDRLPQCRGRQFGRDAWAISGFWRIDDGPVGSLPIVQGDTPPQTSFVVPSAGELQLWFSNTDVFGCNAWDSNFGGNYRFPVTSSAIDPDWMGNASVAITRSSCADGPCDGELRPLDGGFLFDTWARQRATVAEALFQVWEPGVTDVENPDLWEDLDARVYWRFAPDADFAWDWVDFDRRVGNDARYALPLRSIDPLPGATITDPADCPAFPLTVTADQQYVETPVELYFSVNGHELRAADGAPFAGRFQDYVGLYAICL